LINDHNGSDTDGFRDSVTEGRKLKENQDKEKIKRGCGTEYGMEPKTKVSVPRVGKWVLAGINSARYT
jgi:hypothetical protein